MSLRKFAGALVAVVSLTVLGGCAQASKGAVSQSDFAKQLQSQQSVSKKWAQCVAKELFTDRPGKPKLTTNERKLFNASKPDKKVTKTVEQKAEVAGATCGKQGLKP